MRLLRAIGVLLVFVPLIYVVWTRVSHAPIRIRNVHVFDPATVGPQMPEVVHDLPTGARSW